MENILKITNLSIAIRDKILVDDISFTVKTAETLAIIGTVFACVIFIAALFFFIL